MVMKESHTHTYTHTRAHAHHTHTHHTHTHTHTQTHTFSVAFVQWQDFFVCVCVCLCTVQLCAHVCLLHVHYYQAATKGSKYFELEQQPHEVLAQNTCLAWSYILPDSLPVLATAKGSKTPVSSEGNPPAEKRLKIDVSEAEHAGMCMLITNGGCIILTGSVYQCFPHNYSATLQIWISLVMLYCSTSCWIFITHCCFLWYIPEVTV